MKYLIASDIHGSARYCAMLRDRVEEDSPQKLILLGDLLYHGARNPLPPEYDTLRCAAILNSMKEKILCIRGNCDSQVDTLVLEFPVEADFAFLPLKDRTALFMHGHFLPVLPQEGDLLFNGHFHVPAFEKRDGYFYVNCGSVSIPKDGSHHSYLVLEENMLIWKDVQTGEIFRTEQIEETAS